MNPGAAELQTQEFQANPDYFLELQQEVSPPQQQQPLCSLRKENIPSSGTAITGDWTRVQKEGEDIASYPLPSQTTRVSEYFQTLIRSWMADPQIAKEIAQYLTGATKELYEKIIEHCAKEGGS